MSLLSRPALIRQLFGITIIFVALIFAHSRALASVTPTVTLDTESVYKLESRFRMLVDPSTRMQLSEVLRKLPDFRDATANDVMQSYSRSNFWLHMSIKNQTGLGVWYLAANYPLIDFEVYRILPDGGLKIQRPLPERIPARQLLIPAGSSEEFLIRASSRHLVDLHFQISPYAQLNQRDKNEHMFYALLCGIFVAMIIYNFFLYATLRDPNYLLYLIFAVVNFHISLMPVKFPSGILSWGGIDWRDYTDVYRPMAPFTTFLFARSFLRSSDRYPRIDKVMLAYMLGLVLLMTGDMLLPITDMQSIQDVYFMLGILILGTAGIISFRSGFEPSRYYLFGLGAFISGIMIYIAQTQKLIDSNIFTMNAHLFGQAAEMLLMSLALGSKIKELERDTLRNRITAQLKGRLLRVISHDIANPLSVVKAAAYYVKSKDAANNKMPMILKAVELIEDIMQFVQKSESLEGSKKLTLEPVSVANLFDVLAFLFKDKADEKGTRIHFIQEHPDLEIMAEKTSLISEVMSNILNNSVKFSFPTSEVFVKATVVGDRKIMITVEDRGIGMNPSTLSKIFDPLQNTSRSGTKGEKGSGYGMPLAKAYIDLYQAKVEVESIPVEADAEKCGTKIRVLFNRALPVLS